MQDPTRTNQAVFKISYVHKVGKNEDENHDDEESGEVPDAVCDRSDLALPDHIAVTDSVRYNRCQETHDHVVYRAADPFVGLDLNLWFSRGLGWVQNYVDTMLGSDGLGQ